MALFIGCKVDVIVGKLLMKPEPYFTSSSGTHHLQFVSRQDSY